MDKLTPQARIVVGAAALAVFALILLGGYAAHERGKAPPQAAPGLLGQNTAASPLASSTAPALLPLPRPAASTKTMAWLYPGNGVCDAAATYEANSIDVLKPQYFTVSGDDGSLTLLTAAKDGCNGYSAANAASIKANSSQQFVTVSSGVDGLQALVNSSDAEQQAVSTLTQFVSNNGFTGVEIDFEDYASWDAPTYAGYKQFIAQLGGALHAQGAKLMVDVPPIADATEAGYYPITYADIAALPVDYIVVLSYDYDFDQGAGTPIEPNDWLTAIIKNAQASIAPGRLVIGIPSYGYSGATGGFKITRTTYGALSALAGFAGAARDPSSGELTWAAGGTSYDFADSTTLDDKRALAASLGVEWVSVWALGGGDPWF